MKMKLQSEVHDYARVLRAIGQDLDKLVTHSLERELAGNDFVVRGEGRAAQSQLAENANPGVWQRLQNQVGQRGPQQSAACFFPAKCGHLTKVIDDMDSVTVKYRDEQGNPHSEKYSMLVLYKIQQNYYGERGTFEPVDLWRGFDR
jgi:hypothetical protein